MKYLLIFLAGVAVDLVVTWYTWAVSHRRILVAVVTASGITLVNFVFLAVILRGSLQESVVSIGVFALGNAVGTYYALRWLP